MEVRTAMTNNVACCEAGDSLARAAQLMWDNDCGAIPVCSHTDGQHEAIGIVTDRDICMCALLQGRPLNELRVGDAMSRQLKSCWPTASIGEAQAAMREARVRRLPVLDTAGHLVGIVSAADLARSAAGKGRASSREPSVDMNETLAVICEPRTSIGARAGA